MYESTHPMYDAAAEHQKLSGSVTLVLEPTGTDGGVVTVKVTDESPTSDAPANGKSDPITFTLYSVKYQSALTTTNNVTTLVGDGVEYAFDNDVRPLGSYFTFAADSQVPVHYSVDGSGTLAIRQTYTDGSPTSMKTASKSLSTSSSAPVFIDMRRGTNKVKAWVSGGTSQTVIFIYQGSSPTKYPKIEITGGNNQTGATQARLEEPLTVKVTDGNNRPLAGLAVNFASGNTGIMFIPVPGTRVYGLGAALTTTDPGNGNYVDNTAATVPAAPNKPGAGAPIFVQTDRNGVAQTYYQLGSATGAHQVTAALQGIGTVPRPQMFDATAVSGSRSASLVIVSGNNQRSVSDTYDVEDPLVVRVRRPGGYRISNVIIRFTALIGTLEAAPGTEYVTNDDATALPSARAGYTPTGVTATDNTAIKGSVSGQEIFVLTNAHGEAAVVYNSGQIAGAKTVTARVDDEEATTEYDFQIRQVVFNIDGTGSTTPEPSPEPPEDTGDTATLTVTPTTIDGPPGSTRDITIIASGAAQISNLLDFSAAGGSVSQSSGLGTFTSTLTLPSQEARYTLTVTAGTQSETVTVTVSSTAAPETQTGGQIALEIPLSGAANSSQTVRVTILDADGNRVPDVDITLAITRGGGTFSNSRVTTGDAGTVTSTLTLGSTPGTDYFVTASASGYDPVERRISITGTAPPADTQRTDTPPASTAGDPSLISIDGEAIHRGTIDQELDAPLVVEVLDSQGRRVSNARVNFRVRTGQGRLSQLGNGRATFDRTNAQGLARADYTPMSARSTVEAEIRGVTETVTFTIITDGSAPQTGTSDSTTRSYQVRDEIPISLEGTLNFTNPRTLNGITYTCVGPGECVVSYGTVVKGQIQAAPAKATPQREYEVRDQIPISLEDTLIFTGQHAVNGTIYTCVGPGECVVSYGIVSKGQIRVAAASPTATRSTTERNPEVLLGENLRPPMMWVDSGEIYSLVGTVLEQFVAAENVTGIAIGGNKVYWTAETGESAGTINSANLDGSNAKELTAIKAIPASIAVDTNASKLYWTNSRGRIQSANLDGSNITNVLQNLSVPQDIAVARRNLYWTAFDVGTNTGKIGIANPTVRGTPKYISTGTDTPLNLAIGGNKVYWTEQTGESTGTINSANLNGTDVKQLAAIQAVPVGIAVDTARSKLYWTNSRGRIQSANLNGSGIRNVVTGLGMPGDMVMSNSIKAPTEAPEKSTTAAAGKNKYDINGDGSVDSKDSDALIVAVAAGITDAKYDVNGDGKVDISDVVAITANRSAGAASAPTLLGRKFTSVERDRLQDQIDLLVATHDRSPATLKTLIYLQQLLAMARPEKTQLLANYPNPFNPETWIPYELATDTDVRITIYNAQGVVIRTLQLGQQSAGYYTDRERAAYWDGRNALGEQVASGVYYYQLETDTLSLLRKMVILK